MNKISPAQVRAGIASQAPLSASAPDAAVFMASAATRLRKLGYDVGTPKLECTAWGGIVKWKFRPAIFAFTALTLPDFEAPTLDECLIQAAHWLDGLGTEEETCNAILGI